MTEKEAMFLLMLAKSRVSDDKLIKALDMAIKALEKESKNCETKIEGETNDGK